MNDELFRRITQLERRVQELERSKPESGRWVDWTPTVTQSGAVTLTITSARYIVQAGVVSLQARLAITGAGTIGNAITVAGIPISIAGASSLDTLGTAVILDASGPVRYEGAVVMGSATSILFQAHNVANVMGVTPNFALASGDIIGFFAVYEKA
jgi:hypothetical protein